MSIFYLDGKTRKRYQLGRAFTYGDINYTKQGATHETFTSLGFRQVINQARPDDRFYIVSGPDRSGRYNATPKDLDELKVNFVKKERQAANTLLQPTDWYYARFVELGEAKAVPQEIVDFRAAVRDQFHVREDAINASENVEALKAAINTFEPWIESPEL